jgi:hypothetical protein
MNKLCAKHNTPRGHVSHLTCESFHCTIHHGLGPLKLNAPPCQNQKYLRFFLLNQARTTTKCRSETISCLHQAKQNRKLRMNLQLTKASPRSGAISHTTTFAFVPARIISRNFSTPDEALEMTLLEKIRKILRDQGFIENLSESRMPF